MMSIKESFLMIASVAVLTGCASFPSMRNAEPEVVAESRVLNPVMVRKIAEKKITPVGTGFPVLSEMPDTPPDRYPTGEVENLKEGLVDTREGLSSGVSSDSSRADAERAIGVEIIENGRVIKRDLEQAAQILDRRIARDQTAARRLRARKVPELGGLPPKEQRPGYEPPVDQTAGETASDQSGGERTFENE